MDDIRLILTNNTHDAQIEVDMIADKSRVGADKSRVDADKNRVGALAKRLSISSSTKISDRSQKITNICHADITSGIKAGIRGSYERIMAP